MKLLKNKSCNFAFMLKQIRLVLLPFSWLYACILTLRNKLYDWGWKKSYQSEVYTLCVGNLSMGGTGKSPAVEYLIKKLHKNYEIASLSRGYKRKSKGYKEVLLNSTVEEVGDEPFQFKRKYPEIKVAVDENRAHGIQQLTQQHDLKCILLDDAFQHRRVQPHFSILLTVYNDLYAKDFVLPAGNLREPRWGAQRADLIIVTKCPLNLSVEKQKHIKKQLQVSKHQKLFFAGIDYSENVVSTSQKLAFSTLNHFTLVTGIANPKPLIEYLEASAKTYQHLKFPDHHHFNTNEIEKLKKERLILTTEKDFVRLKDFIPEDQLFYLPIEMKLLKHEDKFENLILNSIQRHYEH